MKKLSKISLFHYYKLFVRSALFLIALGVYITGKIKGYGNLFWGAEDSPVILAIIGIFYAVEILLRFIPSPIESMGCQKQFKRNYIPRGENKERAENQKWTATLTVALVWLALNGILGALYLFGVYDAGILILVCLFYAVCDMICILFFCPFQTWFMKNKCCGSCRIYNWDYAMMFTPLVFIPSVYTYSLLGLSLLLLLKWEVTYKMHPERFAENTNCALDCSRCEEKLCQHKRQLRHFLQWRMEKLNALAEKAKALTKTKGDGSKKDG